LIKRLEHGAESEMEVDKLRSQVVTQQAALENERREMERLRLELQAMQEEKARREAADAAEAARMRLQAEAIVRIQKICRAWLVRARFIVLGDKSRSALFEAKMKEKKKKEAAKRAEEKRKKVAAMEEELASLRIQCAVRTRNAKQEVERKKAEKGRTGGRAKRGSISKGKKKKDKGPVFAVGERVIILKEEMKEGELVKSTVYGETATVVDPDWNGMVKLQIVTGEQTGVIKSYKAEFLKRAPGPTPLPGPGPDFDRGQAATDACEAIEDIKPEDWDALKELFKPHPNVMATVTCTFILLNHDAPPTWDEAKKLLSDSHVLLNRLKDFGTFDSSKITTADLAKARAQLTLPEMTSAKVSERSPAASRLLHWCLCMYGIGVDKTGWEAPPDKEEAAKEGQGQGKGEQEHEEGPAMSTKTRQGKRKKGGSKGS